MSAGEILIFVMFLVYVYISERYDDKTKEKLDLIIKLLQEKK